MIELKTLDVAPNFEGISTQGPISLDNLKKKIVVIYFYPKDMTPGCIIQAKDFSNFYDEFKKLGVQIIGVSKDTLYSHNKFCEKENIPYPLIADVEGEICDMYGVFKEKSMFGKTYLGIVRSTFLLNKEKKIFKIWRKVKPKDHAKKVLDAVKTMQLIGNNL